MRTWIVSVAILLIGSSAAHASHSRKKKASHASSAAGAHAKGKAKEAQARAAAETARADAEIAELRGSPRPSDPGRRAPAVQQADDDEIPGGKAGRR